MSNVRKFKGGRTSSSFKNLGSGLRAAEGRITEQRKIEIDALKLLAAQEARKAKLKIDGFADKAAFEEGVLTEHHRLENAARTRSADALALKGDRDVQRLRDIANQKKKEAEFLDQLAPKRAEAALKVVGGVINIANIIEAQSLRRKNAQNRTDEAEQAKTGLEIQSRADFLNSKEFRAASPDEQRFMFKEGVNGGTSRNTIFNNAQFIKFQDNRKSHKVESLTLINKYFPDTLDKDNIESAWWFAGEMKLRELNVHADSDVGRNIMRQYEAEGRLERTKLINVEAAEDTQKTEIIAVDDFHAGLTRLSQLSGKDLDKAWYDINVKFNAAVTTSSKGTYKIGNDYQITLPDGMGGGYSRLLKVFLERHGHKYDTKVLKEHLSRLQIYDENTSDKLSVKQRYTDKHSLRTENEFTDYNAWLNKGAKDALNVKNKVGNSLAITISQEKEAILNDKEGPGYITDDQRLAWMERIHTSNAHNKSELYKLVGFDSKGYSDVGKVLAAEREFRDGDLKNLESIINSITSPKERAKLQARFKVYRDIAEVDGGADFLSGKLSKEIIGKEISKGHSTTGRSSLNQDGELAAEFHKALVVERMEILKDKIPDNGTRYKTAMAEIKKEYIDTAAEIRWNTETNEYELPRGSKGNLNNPFNWISSRGGLASGWKPHVRIPHFDSSDQSNLDIILKARENWDNPDEEINPKKEKSPNIKGIEITELSDYNIETRSYEELLAHPLLVSPNNWDAFAIKLEEDILNPGAHKDLLDYAPYKLKKVAEVHGFTLSKVITDWSNQNKVLLEPGMKEAIKRKAKWWFEGNEKYRISADGQDVARIQNGKVVKPRNLYGYNLVNSAKAQGVNPKSFFAEEFLKDQSLSNSELFNKSIGVEWVVDPESNTPISTDFEKWVNEGGFFHDPSQEWLMSVGLLDWDDTVGWTGTEEQRKKRLDIYNRKKQIKKLRLPLTRMSK